MWEVHLLQHIDAILMPDCHRSAYKVAEAIDRAHCGIVERRHEECARQMRRVMLDEVNLRKTIGRHAKSIGERRAYVAHFSRVAKAVANDGEIGPFRQREHSFAQYICPCLLYTSDAADD